MRTAAARALAAVLVALSLSQVGPPAPAPASPGGLAPAASSVRVGSFNIRAGVSLASFQQAVDDLKPMVDVAGLQEIGSNDKNRYLRADHDWGYYRPEQLQQNPVIWRRDRFDFVSADGYKLADGRDVGDELGAGASPVGDSYATIVRLVQRDSGHQISFVNVHLVHGAVKGGRPVPDRPLVYALYKAQVAGLVRAIKAERERSEPSDQILVGGDFNVGYKADKKHQLKKLPYRRMTSLGLTSMWQDSPYLDKPFGTHNDALIDQVWTTEPSTGEKIVRSIDESDHRPAIATYTLPPPDAGYLPIIGSIGFGAITGDNVEADGPSKVPTLFVHLQGDLRHGYAGVEVVEGSAKQGYDHDFVIDDSSLYDNDPGNDVVAVDIVGDRVHEPLETFTLRLVDPVNTLVTAGEVTVPIVDDDRP